MLLGSLSDDHIHEITAPCQEYIRYILQLF